MITYIYCNNLCDLYFANSKTFSNFAVEKFNLIANKIKNLK